MQIKKAALLSGLTERAVRLYEERGLITPEHINKNGRDFREYSDADVEKLKTIASLRRALFTIEEIKEMEDYPSMIPEIVNSHRERMHIDFENLSYLVNHIDRVDETSVSTTEELAAAIFAPPKLSERTTDPTEEEKILFSEQYEKIYEKYFSENTGWERWYSLSLKLNDFYDKLHFGFFGKLLKFCGIALCVGIVFFFVAYGIADVREVEYTLSGYSFYVSDETDKTPHEIRIEGRYKNYLIRDDTFEGLVYVDGYITEIDREPYRCSFFVSEKGLRTVNIAVSSGHTIGKKYGEITHADRAYTEEGESCLLRILANFSEDFELEDVTALVYSQYEGRPGSYTWDGSSRVICTTLTGDPSRAYNIYTYTEY